MSSPGCRSISTSPPNLQAHKTVADLFHHALRQGRDGPKADVTRALQAMKEGLRLGKATPAEIARYADQAGIWTKVQPYLDAMTVDG